MNGTDWDDLNSDSSRLDGVPVSELLSAYYDGELSAEERLRVEAWLEQNPKAREILTHFSELSTLVGQAGTLSSHELKHVAAQSLQERVLSRVAAPLPSARFARTWQRWGIALLAAAASLTLVVFLIPPGRRNQPVAMNTGVQNAPLPDVMVASEIAETKEASPKLLRTAAEAVRGQADAVTAPAADERTPMKKMAADSAFAPAPGQAPEPAPASTPAPGSSPVPIPGPRVAADAAKSGAGASQRAMPAPSVTAPQLPQLAPGTRVDPGEIIHHLATRGDEAVVIEYTVVDVRKTAGELEVLLRKHGIQTLRAEARENAGDRESGGAAKPKAAAEDSGMFAIYVEADNDQLAAALKDFRALPTSLDVIDSQRADKKDEEKSQDGAPPPQAAAKEGADRARTAPQKGAPSIARSAQEPPAAEPREQGAYQVQFPLTRSEAKQIPRRSQNVPKQQQGYGDYLQQRRIAEPKGETAASRVLIVLQAEDAEKM